MSFCRVFQTIDGGILDIRNMTFADAGDYECIIKSAVGRIASKTSVFVYGPPGPPGKLYTGLHVLVNLTFRF
jgi:hypothetical protein